MERTLDSVNVSGQGTARFTYDSRGRPLTQVDAAGNTVSIAYEPTGWQNTKQVTTRGDRTTTYGNWDAWGRATQVTTPDNKTARTTYDVLGRVTRDTLPDLGVVRYFYGVASLDSLKDARNQTFRATRNQLGWVETEYRPDDGSTHRTAIYDRYGRVVSSTDRRGLTVTYGYDSHDRVTQTVMGTDTTTWAYSPDQPGSPTAPTWVRVQNRASTDSLHYDGQGRLARTVTLRNLQGISQKYELSYTYTTLGAVDSVKYRIDGGSWVASKYTQSATTGLLNSVKDFGGRTTSMSYNPDGLPGTITYPNSQAATLTWTANQLLNRIAYSGSSLNAAAGVGYSYDDADRIMRRSFGGLLKFRDFLYDENGRLEQHTDLQRNFSHTGCQLVVDEGWVCPDDGQFTQLDQRTYTYDLTGNPTDRSAVIGNNNRLTSYDGWTLTYDDEGNLTGKSKTGSPSYTFHWNPVGQLDSVRVNGSTAARYTYDGMGRRVSRYGSGGLQYYVYDGDDLLLTVNASGMVTDEYTYLPGTDQPLGLRRSGTPYYFHTDATGNVLALTDLSGNVVNQYRYSPFGVTEYASETVGNTLRFAGREWDNDVGLYYNRARWYDPQLQRFISQDPIGIEGGLNMYAYAGNDPVNGSDPFGLVTCVKKNALNFIGGLRGGAVGGSELFWECDFWGIPPIGFGDLHEVYGGMCTTLFCSQEPLPPNPGERFGRCEVAEQLRGLIAALSSNPRSFYPVYNSDYDFKAIDEGDHGGAKVNYYWVGDKWLRSDEFGNFAAGYAGQSVFGTAGYAAMRIGGVMYSRNDDSTEDRWDLASAPMISAGATRAVYDLGLPGTRVNYGVQSGYKSPTLTSTAGCVSN